MRRGFSLIEVLLAMAIFLIGMTSLLALFQFGGVLETESRAHSRLSTVASSLADELVRDAWRLDPSGRVGALEPRTGEPVPGHADYRYDFLVEELPADLSLVRASLRFYRRSPDRPAAVVRFLLPVDVPLERRLEESHGLDR